MPHKCLLILLFLGCCHLGVIAAGKNPPGGKHAKVRRYNVDSLLQTFRVNPALRDLLDQGSALFDEIGLKEEGVSRPAFEIAYLTRKLIDQGKLLPGDALVFSRIKKNILVVADYTKPAGANRLAVVDLDSRKLLFNTLVAHGRGVGNRIDPEHGQPLYFSNINGTNLSSLGFIVTGDAMTPGNDCHWCKYMVVEPHVCQMRLYGLEGGMNEQILGRAIVVHTTGSLNWADPSLTKRPLLNRPKYHIDLNDGFCYIGDENKHSGLYATAAYIDTAKVIGRSEGCLVLPEEIHKEVIKAIIGGSLIFSYSDVVNDRYNYFGNSSVLGQIRELATGNGLVPPKFSGINSRTLRKWNPDWNTLVYNYVMRYRTAFLHNDQLAKGDIEVLWPGFYQATDEQKGAFWVAVVATLARFNSSFNADTTASAKKSSKLAEGLMQLSYTDEDSYRDWDVPLRWKSKNILNPVVNLQTGVAILAAQLTNGKALFNPPKTYWPVLNNKKEEFITFFKSSFQGF